MNKENIFIILFFATLLIWCFALAYPMQPDYDIWARLIAGKSVFENGIILKNDFLSYTPTHSWYDHEWLSGTVFYYLTTIADKFHKTTIEMLSAFKSILTFLIFALAAICTAVRKPKYSPPYQILYFTFAAFAANVVFASTIRCHMFTFLFFTLWILVLELYRKYKKNSLLIILPITMILWANMHGGCISGLGLLLIYAAGEFLNKKDFRPYLITLFVSFLVLFINPYGIDYVKFLFAAGTMNRNLISEWNSPFCMLKQTYKFTVFFLFMGIIALLEPLVIKINIRKTDKTKIILLTLTALIAVLYTKLLPFFVITASIFMFDDVYRILGKISCLTNFINHKNLVIYALILLISLTVIDTNDKHRYGFINHAMYPYKAVQFIKENALVGNLFTEFSYGSYCIYKLYPQNKIFMDGRYEEVYNPSLLNVMKNFIKQEGENPNAVLTDYPTDIVLLYNPPEEFIKNIKNKNNRQKVFETLKKLNWRKVYKDEFFEIYIREDYPAKIFRAVEYEPLKLSLSMFETNISQEILLKAANNRISPFTNRIKK